MPDMQALVAGQAAFVRDLLNKPPLFVLGNEALLLELGGQG